MRVVPITIILLFLAPNVGSIAAPQAEALPDSLTDGDLLRLLARLDGIEIGPTKAIEIPRGLTLDVMVMHLAQRAGLPSTNAQAFQQLDPRLARPTLELLVAMDQAWTLVDASHATLSLQQLRYLAAHPEEASLAASIDKRALFEGAILILDTLENSVLPQLQLAADAGAWPASPITDSRCATVVMTVCSPSVLRIGGTGNDKDNVDHILILDARGDDWYYNNAGGATLLDTLDPTILQTPVALAVDLTGDDHYWSNGTKTSQGAAGVGIGILYEAAGNDVYRGAGQTQGAASNGIGYLRDRAGNDTYGSGEYSTGGAGGSVAVGILREDGGNDRYTVGGNSGGGAYREGTVGLLWDRNGTDNYGRNAPIWYQYGWGELGGRGWLVDEGTGADYYATATDLNFPHGCNDCTWLAGFPGPANGRGNDNAGGLAALLSENGALPP